MIAVATFSAAAFVFSASSLVFSFGLIAGLSPGPDFLSASGCSAAAMALASSRTAFTDEGADTSDDLSGFFFSGNLLATAAAVGAIRCLPSWPVPTDIVLSVPPAVLVPSLAFPSGSPSFSPPPAPPAR